MCYVYEIGGVVNDEGKRYVIEWIEYVNLIVVVCNCIVGVCWFFIVIERGYCFIKCEFGGFE